MKEKSDISEEEESEMEEPKEKSKKPQEAPVRSLRPRKEKKIEKKPIV